MSDSVAHWLSALFTFFIFARQGASAGGEDHKVKDRRKPFPFGEIQIRISLSWIPESRIVASFSSVDSETSCCNVFCGTVIDLGAFVSVGFATCDWHVANRNEYVWVSEWVSVW